MKRAVLVIGMAMATVGLMAVSMTAATADPVFGRQFGLDRYGTAAAVSSVAFPSGANVVFLASGQTFPDALAGGPYAASYQAPILLVTQGSVPNATAQELARLHPKQIILLGGTSSITASVAQAVAKYASVEVRRISGANRYDTASQISSGFTAPLTTVYVASGADFPDALAGGPAIAGTTGGPVLLVQPNAVPASTAAELTRLKPKDIIVLGGSSTVSDAVVTTLAGYAVDPPLRRAGTDRYDTAAKVSSAFASAPKVYLATGVSFADALAGGAVAGMVKGPVLLVHQDCIPFEVNLEITRLNPTNVILLGGESSLGPAVLARQVC